MSTWDRFRRVFGCLSLAVLLSETEYARDQAAPSEGSRREGDICAMHAAASLCASNAP